MNVQEFTQRTGYTPATEEEWKAIETMYMEAGDSVDKDLFCKEWLKHKDSRLLNIFYQRSMDKADTLKHFREMCAEAAHLLISKSDDFDDNDMYWQAVKLIGQKRVVLHKTENGFELNKADRDYITDNLQ